MTSARVAEIWRYPVKSMQGEQLDSAHVGPAGVQGDRYWAVVDAQSGVSLSAKRYPDLLQCSAWTDDDVVIRLPDGGQYRAGSDDAARGLSKLLGRNVTMRSADSVETIRHEFPAVSTEGTGDPLLHELEAESFVDCSPLHLLTTATLRKLRQLLPDSEIRRARFRPNFLIEIDGIGFVEQDWVHSDVMLGTLRCRVYDDTRRCIMTAHAQQDIARDMRVIRTVLKSNEGRAGVALMTNDSGTVRSGAKLVLSD